MVRSRLVLSLVAAGLALIGSPLGAVVTPASTAPRASFAAEPEEDCAENVPASHAVAGVNDTGRPVSLDVLVLLDGISKSSAQRTMSIAAQSYAPVKIKLRVVGYRAVRFRSDGQEFSRPTRDAAAMMADVKAATRRSRPKGVDVVLALTNKAIYIKGPGGDRVYGIAGMADCIGGVRYGRRSFAFGVGDYGTTDWPARDAAITAAHEVGHLLGAHHHYANCAEGGPPPAMCTVMFNASLDPMGMSINSQRFGVLESAVVRGHAVDYARP